MRNFLCLLLLSGVFAGCGGNLAKRTYLLAERLWSNGQYKEAVEAFEKVSKVDVQGDLGRQALFRAAMTETIYLGRHEEALQKFKRYIQGNQDQAGILAAKKQIGEILFAKLNRYGESALFYEEFLKASPPKKDVPELLFRQARSQFFHLKFANAVELFEKIIKEHSNTPWAERAKYEIGVTYFTSGEHSLGGWGDTPKIYKKAIDAYERLIREHPTSALVPEAWFGIGSSYEEQDQLVKAEEVFSKLESTYPSPKVIKIKLYRIRERIAQKQR